jgi:hypothetical protein
MIVDNIDMYLDGGTVIVSMKNGPVYYFDFECDTKTPGRLSGGETSQMTDEEKVFLQTQIFEAMKLFKNNYLNGSDAIEMINEHKEQRLKDLKDE